MEWAYRRLKYSNLGVKRVEKLGKVVVITTSIAPHKCPLDESIEKFRIEKEAIESEEIMTKHSEERNSFYNKKWWYWSTRDDR